MSRYILLGLAVFVLVAIAAAPASILDRIVSQTDAAQLTHSRGTLWRGQADLLLQDSPMGQLNWDFNVGSLFKLRPTYQWTLTQSDWQLGGLVGTTPDEVNFDVSGQLDALAVNQWLALYDISSSGTFDIQPTQISVSHDNGQPTYVSGQINWSGGQVRYTLSGVLRETKLPPLVAYLDMSSNGEPQATVFAQNDQTPLLIATIGANGYAKVGMTKRFTLLLNNPWPGTDPDHKIVVKVEEKVF